MDTASIHQLLFTSWPGFAALLVILALVKILAPAFFRKQLGEMRVVSALRGLDTATYHHFHDLELPHPTGQGSVRIEHVVVSPYGVFVVGTTRRRGWITGTAHEPEWIQRLHFRRSRFQNPLQPQRDKVDALMQFLRLPDPPFHPLLVFTRDCAFKNPQPGIVLRDSLISTIRRHTVTMLDAAMVRRAVSRLADLQESLNREAAEKPQLHALHVRQAV